MKNKIKKILSFITKFFKKIYTFFYLKPIIFLKIRESPAINEFKVYNTFHYDTYSFYPAIMKKNPKKAKKILNRVVSIDELGIPLLKNSKQKYWPVTIAQYGLLNYNFYLQYGKNEYKDNFLKICDWLKDNISERGIWEYKIKIHCNVVDEDLVPPFPSAMAQGEGISTLVRGYYLFHNEEYLEVASKALDVFTKTPEEGGVLRHIGDMFFYEEYPTNTPSLVLNGFIYSLFGLYDFSNTHHPLSSVSKKLFDSGYETLESLIPLYDSLFCSRYDLSYITKSPKNDNRNPFYHFIHVNQMIAINSIRESEILKFYIKKWR